MAAPAKITVKETPLDEAVKVNAAIPEFGAPYPKDYFEERCKGKERLVLVAYFADQPIDYLVGYDRFSDGSFYCWMTGVNPKFRGMGALKAMIDYQEMGKAQRIRQNKNQDEEQQEGDAVLPRQIRLQFYRGNCAPG